MKNNPFGSRVWRGVQGAQRAQSQNVFRVDCEWIADKRLKSRLLTASSGVCGMGGEGAGRFSAGTTDVG